VTLPQGDTRTPHIVEASIPQLIERARSLAASGRRRVLGITGTPGAGKSTVCAQLQEALGESAVLVGMDGFHFANAELERLGRRERKGSPDTFDVAGYVALLSRLRAQREGVLYAPLFDRALEESIGSAVAVPADVPLILTEGNYLLHQEHGWHAVAARLDESWFLDIDADERRLRLLTRRASFGHPADAAAAWVDGVDLPNALLVEAGRERADLIIRVTDTPASLSDTHSEGVRP